MVAVLLYRVNNSLFCLWWFSYYGGRSTIQSEQQFILFMVVGVATILYIQYYT